LAQGKKTLDKFINLDKLGWNLPRVKVVFYKDGRGRSPVLEWVRKLDQKAQDKCFAKIGMLREEGHALVRPAAAHLGGKLYELRITSDRNEYRILYFFYEKTAVILCHSFIKKDKRVPKREIKKALRRLGQFVGSPKSYSFGGKNDGKQKKKRA